MLLRAGRLAPLLTLLLCLPALGLGLQLDDLGQKLALGGVGPGGIHADPLWDLFAFVRPGEQAETLVRLGIAPWWADPELHMVFVRPVSVMTHLLDEALWPDLPALAHAHSLLWMALAVLLAGRLYTAVEGEGRVAALATLLFAVEDAHGWPAAWLANRNGVVALVLGLGSLLLHLRGRQGDRRAAVAAVVLFGVALFAGESALATAGWLFAAQLCLDGGRLRPLLPYVAVAAIWRPVWGALGGAAHNSGLYIDPGELGRWLPVLPERLTWLMAAQWLQVPADAWIVVPDSARLGCGLLLAAGLVAVAIALGPTLRTSTTARFWALGMALSAVPPTGAMPMDRLLTFTSVGAMGLLAVASAGGARLRPFLMLHGPIAALMLIAKVLSVGQISAAFFTETDVVGAHPRPAEARIWFANGTEFTTVYVGIRRRLLGLVEPAEVGLLATNLRPNTYTRVDDDTLRIRTEGGWLATSSERLLRGPRPFAVGETIARSGFVVEVRALNEAGRPAEIEVHFRRPVDHPDHVWMAFTCDGLGPWRPPAVGETVQLEAYGLLGCGGP